MKRPSRSFQQVLDTKPDHEASLFNLGLALCLSASLKRGSESGELYIRAEDAYTRLTKLSPNSRIAWYNLALAAYSRATVTEAVHQSSPDSSSTEEALVLLYKSALESFKRVLVISPNDAKATQYARECERAIRRKGYAVDSS
mmetsp:Transcript_23785/g.59110  ORF Transcript_23785/g.59110 Transcript_23785/m.59110 type:complete len:143 (-) Transcript_23785:807-1235(-)